MKTAKRLGGSASCSSIEDKGPICPRRGRDGPDASERTDANWYCYMKVT